MSSAPPAADATVASFQQCANGPGTALTCASGWINGSMQGGNSHFREDDVVPQRVVINLPADNALHTLTFTFQDRKGSVHAYDSLGTWNKTVENADCFVKTNEELFLKMYNGHHYPGVGDFLSGRIKSNNPYLMKTFVEAFSG